MSVLDTFPQQSVLVVGDLMLDQYIRGTVSRISPEAPVCVIEEQSVSYIPGGAGNVAANLASLGANVCVVGGIGNDHGGELLQQTLERQGVNVSGMVSLSARPTTTKTRVVAHSQQMIRIDREEARP